MADENSAGPITEIAVADATAKVPAPKKQRAPRRQKAAAEATVAASLAKAAKVQRGRRQRAEESEEAKLTPETQVTGKSTTKDAIKGTRRKRTPKQPEQTAEAPASAMDEMADLIQLEEENKRLRKTLSDKLRAENADLRKRLGLD
ncbi:SyrB-like regulator [Pararhizobium sp. A13]|uniref:SyrB-like regulator n=1 Tax=Pararhizobium sp. A13 TaxID=3133975 RepID=UPI00311B07A2